MNTLAENTAGFTVLDVEPESGARSIESHLEELDGVVGATVDPETGEAEVRYDDSVLAEERVERQVREFGYELDERDG